MTLKLSAFVSLMLIGLFWAVAFIGDLSFISSNLTGTSALMATAMADVAMGLEIGGNSFLVTAFILNLVPSPINWYANLLIGSIALRQYAQSVRHKSVLGPSIFIVLPAIILFMPRLLKESILIPLFMICVFLLRVTGRRISISALIFMLFTYGYFIRSYYLLIASMFCLVFAFRRVSLKGKILLIFVVLMVLAYLSPEHFQMLQGGGHRGGTAMQWVRTSFANPFEATSLVSFLLNYLYAIVRLNFPIFFTQSPLEIFHMLCIASYGWVVVQGLRSVRWEANISAEVIIAQALILWLFEPDLGSYLRHLTSSFPFAGVVIAAYCQSPTSHNTVRAPTLWAHVNRQYPAGAVRVGHRLP